MVLGSLGKGQEVQADLRSGPRPPGSHTASDTVPRWHLLGVAVRLVLIKKVPAGTS